MKLDWTPTAWREFWDASLELQKQNPAAAESWRADVADMIRMLEYHPHIGHRHRTTSEGEFREVIVGRYRFIYRVSETVLKMRRVRHVRRKYDPQRIREGVPRGFPAFVGY